VNENYQSILCTYADILNPLCTSNVGQVKNDEEGFNDHDGFVKLVVKAANMPYRNPMTTHPIIK
jgi:hypothetical protein